MTRAIEVRFGTSMLFGQRKTSKSVKAPTSMARQNTISMTPAVGGLEMGQERDSREHIKAYVERHSVKIDVAAQERERSHIEQVVIQRFNYLIVFVGVTVTAALTAGPGLWRFATFVTGTWIVGIVAGALYRAQQRLNVAIELIYLGDAQHPISIARRVLENEDMPQSGSSPAHGSGLLSRRDFIGKTAPTICLIVMILFAGTAAIEWMCSVGRPVPARSSTSAASCPQRAD